VTADRRAGLKRSARGTGRRGLVALAGAALALPLLGGPAAAQSFLDPADPCIGAVAPAGFSDRASIPEVHRRNVDCAARERITEGQTSTQFNPAGTVTRGQMASFIVRVLRAGGHQLPAPQDRGFTDIGSSVHRDAINQLSQIGVAQGVTSSRYEPQAPVRRDQMASFVVRAAEYAYRTPAGAADVLDGNTVGAFPFSDVAQGNVHRANIAAAVELLGVSVGVEGSRYEPAGSTTRAQMATFVIRLLDVTLIPRP
jgi:hypothetical protein